MNKQEIIAWLNNNFEKTYKEIENFLFLLIQQFLLRMSQDQFLNRLSYRLV